MIFNESEQITALRDMIRKFLEREAPLERVAEWDRQDKMPREIFDAMADLGICGLMVPEEYGGLGVDVVATMVVVEELARRSISIATIYLMNVCYGSMDILAFGSEAQKQEFLPRLAAGELIFSLGLSEPDVGADLASAKVTARREGEKIIINGTKRWCTGANMTDYIYALVRSGEPDARHKNLSFLIIPTDAPGISMSHWPTMGFHGIATNDVMFDDVEVGLDAVVGGEEAWNRGWQMLTSAALEAEKLVCAATALGIATQAVEDAWQYAQERKQFGKPICTIQSMRHLLAEVQTQLLAARLMAHNAAQLTNANLPCAAQTSMAKNFVTQTCVEIVLTCQRILGAYGYATEFPMERYVRDVLCTRILGGSTEIHKNNIANRLGLPR
ncbi:acyl-CoA dehydrogenase family protein [Pseudoxanthomonas sp.]|uniref:acyl-CoA dehydrogenase family protein n=1 Tax=Pseudoxanthomonas sp. TaxID=1871049 RepID=UPI002607B40E|nr:acyl-CoA dehydrogenase family protein [Pseudoxanthomonas sp.]WDS36947.1 MAG: acyl-CoA/acyl-ACP dehydrogenase [Pseudoxanthomonas sp.]